jgi:RNA polymerase sigma-70 factor (ECF subfamily)
MTADDRTVVERVLGGETNAFRVLVERYQDRVYGYLLRMVSDEELARDLAQETFLRAYRGLAGYRREAAFGTWLIQIGIHAARDELRSRRRAALISLDEIRSAVEGRAADDDSGIDPLRHLEDVELVAHLEKALAELPPDYREVFLLKHVEEMSYEGIAEQTGDSVGTLKVRAHRARKHLREALIRSEQTRDRRPRPA